MCGRFSLATRPETLAEEFHLAEAPVLEPRFNIAPGQPVATVSAAAAGRRVLAERRWGLVPHWASDPRIGARLINARSETVVSKAAFRDAFRSRRCLVPADGFYEWADAEGGPRQPYHVSLATGRVFAMAGLWERWSDPAGGWLETCTVLTTRSGRRLRPIHDRMPVILPPATWEIWLDPRESAPGRLVPLLKRYPDEQLRLHRVSRRVNRPEHDDAGCIEPLADGALP